MAARRKNSRTRRAAPKRVRRRATAGTGPARPQAAPRRATAKRAAPAARARRAPRGPEPPLAPNGKPVTSGIGVAHHHMDYTTHDLSGLNHFYGEVLGFGNVVHFPEQGYLTVFTTPRSSLGFMTPQQGPPESWRPPGEPGLYFFVADVDRAHRELLAKGVAFELPPTDMPWGHRMALLRDPEGRLVSLAQDLRR
jgi:catechol 2,3-dioxygenase-like lactoylglutathione lyase family enzyme